MRIETKVVKGFNGGHQVEFWIGNQGFRLQEVFKDGDWSSYRKAKWYKKQLDTAFNGLTSKCKENMDIIEDAIVHCDGFADWIAVNHFGYTQEEWDATIKKGVAEIEKLIQKYKNEN